MDKRLIDAAMAARNKAYAPYSNHPVGAAILTDDGQIFAGCNVENAASPLGNCAETGAVSAMVAGGRRKIAAVAIVGPDSRACQPCGGCRQVLAEFGEEDMPVYLLDGKTGDVLEEYKLGELLPHIFRRKQ